MDTPTIDEPIQDGRGAPAEYHWREQLGMRLWRIVWLMLVYPVPKILSKRYYPWLLRLFGATLGRGVVIFPSASVAIPWMLTIDDFSLISGGVDLYSLGPIVIGRHTVISQGAVLCAGTHDYTKISMPLIRSPIQVGNGCWICMQAFIGPGSVIGDHAVVGARAVVFGTIPPHVVCGGNPCRPIKKRVFDPR